jgi:hypothetical protein
MKKEPKQKMLYFSKKELKLLLMILEEASDSRSSMGCNDPYEDEEKLFSKKEIRSINENYLREDKGLEDDEELDYIFNFDFVDYMIKRIEEQI